MTVGIVRTHWTGTSGGPGLTQMVIAANPADTWLATEAQTAVDAVRAFWNSLAARLPNEVVLTVSPVVDQYNEVNGQLVATTTAATAPATVTGTATGVYAGGTGAKLVWNTGAIVSGRRVRGATYIVPLEGGSFSADGTVNSTARGVINTAASSLLSTLTAADLFLQVWSRPETLTSNDGVRSNVTSGLTNTKSAILRGRRD